MIEIKRHGSYLETDENGFVFGIKKAESQEKWKPIIKDVIHFYKEKFKDNLHSIYIRGSVAKGEAVEYVSDLDSFAILKKDPGEVDSPFSEEFQNEMNKKYPFCSHIEITFTDIAKLDDEFPPRKRSVLAELIKTQSICVYGEDLAAEIEPFVLKDMLGHSYFIEEELKTLRAEFEEAKDDRGEILDLCTWITRRLVRSGFDLVMEREEKFTRDLYLCYESFIKYYPEQKDNMYVLLNLSLNPIDDVEEIMRAVDVISPWLIEEINNQLK